MNENNLETAILGGGCFWCVEAVFEGLTGVISVMPGYAGGDSPIGKAHPTYEQVSGGETGHAEVIKVEFDPSRISYKNLLTVFFATHDPTTLNRQGNDVGTQYRSMILYTTEGQKNQAQDFIKELGAGVVTEVKHLDKFYEAENYHREYYRKNPDQAYCQLVINPKIEKLKKQFSNLLKSHHKNN